MSLIDYHPERNPEKTIIYYSRDYGTYHHTMISVIENDGIHVQRVLFQRAENCDWCAEERRKKGQAGYHPGTCHHFDAALPLNVLEIVSQKNVTVTWARLFEIHQSIANRYHVIDCNCQDYCNDFYNRLGGTRVIYNEVKDKIHVAGGGVAIAAVGGGMVAGVGLAGGASVAMSAAVFAAPVVLLGLVGLALARPDPEIHIPPEEMKLRREQMIRHRQQIRAARAQAEATKIQAQREHRQKIQARRR